MIGYGSEDTHFVMELTYNYNVNSYELGNDYVATVIASNLAIANAKKFNWPIEQKDGYFVLKSPDGYPFYILDEPLSDCLGMYDFEMNRPKFQM